MSNSRAGIDKQSDLNVPSPARSDCTLPLDSKISISIDEHETNQSATGVKRETTETLSVNPRKETSGLRDDGLTPKDLVLPLPSNGVHEERKATTDGSDPEECLPLAHVKKLKVPRQFCLS